MSNRIKDSEYLISGIILNSA